MSRFRYLTEEVLTHLYERGWFRKDEALVAILTFESEAIQALIEKAFEAEKASFKDYLHRLQGIVHRAHNQIVAAQECEVDPCPELRRSINE